MKDLSVLALAALLVGCAGKIEYMRPMASPGPSPAQKEVDRSKDDVWARLVPELGKRFFVINNLDKSSGLINVSYNGDPERYLDCGVVSSYVKNAAGERSYNFSGAAAETRYEEMSPQSGLVRWHRSMNLEGRMNVIVEEYSKNRTRVTVNTRYVVQRTNRAWNASGQPFGANTDTISFNTGGRSSFPPGRSGTGTECVATGSLEDEILQAVH